MEGLQQPPSRRQFLEPGGGQSAGWGRQWQEKVLRKNCGGLWGQLRGSLPSDDRGDREAGRLNEKAQGAGPQDQVEGGQQVRPDPSAKGHRAGRR